MRPSYLTVFLIALAGLSVPTVGQDSRPATRPADRIIVNVHHDADDPKDPKCPPFVAADTCRNDAHWHISMSGRRYDFTKDGMAKFGKALTELGKAKLEDPAKGISALTLVIRADRTAPYGYVQKVLEQAGGACIYKVEVGAGVPKETFVERPATQPARTESRSPLPALPVQMADEGHEIKVTLRWRERERVVERWIGGLVSIPEGPQGDAAFEEVVRAKVRRSWPASVTIIVTADRAVPWRAVVGILDAGKSGGAANLEFGTWAEAESRRESRPTTDRPDSTPAIEPLDAGRLFGKLWPTSALGDLRLASGRRSTPIFARFPVLGGGRDVSTATLAYDLPTGRALIVCVGNDPSRELEHHTKRAVQLGAAGREIAGGDVRECRYAVFLSPTSRGTDVIAILAMRRVRIEVFHEKAQDLDADMWNAVVSRLAARLVDHYAQVISASQ
jgi:biopolymer transport protein ExbD